MIVSQLNKKGTIQKPFIFKKDRSSVKNPEGRWGVWTYSHVLITKNERKFKYRQVRYAGVPARFQTIDAAKEFALYLVGL